MQASAGAQMYCFGPQRNGPAEMSERRIQTPLATPSTGLANVDAANRDEDQAKLRSLHRRPVGDFCICLGKICRRRMERCDWLFRRLRLAEL